MLPDRKYLATNIMFRSLRDETTSEPALRPPAIAPSILDLCSAPYKALRFASTALARGYGP